MKHKYEMDDYEKRSGMMSDDECAPMCGQESYPKMAMNGQGKMRQREGEVGYTGNTGGGMTPKY